MNKKDLRIINGLGMKGQPSKQVPGFARQSYLAGINDASQTILAELLGAPWWLRWLPGWRLAVDYVRGFAGKVVEK